MDATAAWLEERVRDVRDFPQPGVVFKDITPLLADHAALTAVVAGLAEAFCSAEVDKVVGVEARGFIVASPVALNLGAGFVPVRKAGKLPSSVLTTDYELEYGSATLEIHSDALQSGERVLIIDDVLATGGTASATRQLVSDLGAIPVGFGCVIELGFLGGRQRLGALQTESLLKYG